MEVVPPLTSAGPKKNVYCCNAARRKLWKEFGTFIRIKPGTKAYRLLKKLIMSNYHERLGVTKDVFADRMRK